MRKKLKAKAALILDRLDALGVDVFRYIDNAEYYQQPAEKVYKLSPEKRARAAKLARIRRAKAKADRARV